MATWYELDDEEEADKNEGEANLAFMVSTFSKSEVDYDSDSKDAGGIL